MGIEKGPDQAQARRGGWPSTNHTHESTNQAARVSVLSHVIMVIRGFVARIRGRQALRRLMHGLPTAPLAGQETSQNHLSDRLLVTMLPRTALHKTVVEAAVVRRAARSGTWTNAPSPL